MLCAAVSRPCEAVAGCCGLLRAVAGLRACGLAGAVVHKKAAPLSPRWGAAAPRGLQRGVGCLFAVFDVADVVFVFAFVVEPVAEAVGALREDVEVGVVA